MIVMIGSAATPLMTRAANPNVAVVDRHTHSLKRVEGFSDVTLNHR